MSAAQDHHEIIIIKRNHDDHDDHHGGAWKIAFADFMTAMFCLFLVLWLVNAANEETKQAVASYFNPVKLVDRNRSVKGLYDAQGVQEIEVVAADGKGEQGTGETTASSNGEADDEGNPSGDAAFFADPYQRLDQIASTYQQGDAAQREPMSGARSWTAEQTDGQVETFFDPFAPERWTELPREPLSDAPLSETGQPPVPSARGQSGAASGPTSVVPAETTSLDPAATAEGAPAGSAEPQDIATAETAAPDGIAAEPVAEAGEQSGPAASEAAEAAPETGTGAPADTAGEGEQTEQATVAEPADPDAATRAEAEALRAALTDALNEALGEGNVVVEQLSVEALPDAILISLTDNLQIPMFEIGSAVPAPPLVVALEKVGGVIGEKVGGIRIEGHTDSRPFVSGTSDNWQLSAARAQAAYYMLVRGGVPEARFRAVTGKADRDLAVPGDPLSARNRRIDILLELGEP